MSRRSHGRSFLVGCSLLSMFAGSVALAQVAPPAPPATPEAVDDTSAPETPPPSQDIVVTAQKRAVSVTKVPTTIDVVSGEALQNLKVSSFDTLNGIVPSLSIERAAGGNVTMAIRGVGTTSAGQTLEQSVAAYINGVYMGGAIREFSTPLYDLERVEALSGTQSGIAGQNTSVGAINIVTRQPGNRFGGYVRVGHEFRYNGLNAEGALDLPLTEDLKVRVTGFADKTGGWLNNIVTGTRPGRGRVYSGRLNAVWTPASNVRVSLYGQYDNGFRIGTSYTTYNYPDYIPGIGNETTKVIASDPGRKPV